ncbi:ATP11-domain-containing protein [Thelephora ganbajun]|uniref:ATP11-domain-containing protein n=1 Tax=Thelephora ganbajun TaxID=370292 RepID=A0ACB6ZXJ5_THEGA|nr:ATP11-domain-containing protein [Thelephora ganbajun]
MLRLNAYRATPRVFSLYRSLRRHLHIDYESKYSDKLQKRAQELGKSLNEIRQEIKEAERFRLKQWSEERGKKLQEEEAAAASAQQTSSGASTSGPTPAPRKTSRKDNSPVKPLADILNLDRLLEKTHTAEQISSLWTAYHASRSKGTGRGFICASVPLDTYEKLMVTGKKYPSFAVPLPRDAVQDDSGEAKRAYEFYFLQWDFHDTPPTPTPSEPFFRPPSDLPASNPQTSTVLLTPLQEYKSRTTFATAYLILTFYTDLASSHGLVLLRGEITSTAASTENNSNSDFLLSQQDAQLLTMHLQRFYLWGGEEEGAKERYRLLEAFHNIPEEFKWEDLLKHAEPI